MWISREKWSELMFRMAGLEKLVGHASNVACGRKMRVIKFGCEDNLPGTTEVTLFLSSHEWSQIEKSNEWEKLKHFFLE